MIWTSCPDIRRYSWDNRKNPTMSDNSRRWCANRGSFSALHGKSPAHKPLLRMTCHSSNLISVISKMNRNCINLRDFIAHICSRNFSHNNFDGLSNFWLVPTKFWEHDFDSAGGVRIWRSKLRTICIHEIIFDNHDLFLLWARTYFCNCGSVELKFLGFMWTWNFRNRNFHLIFTARNYFDGKINLLMT